MLRSLTFIFVTAAMALPTMGADLSGYSRQGDERVGRPAPLDGRGRYLAVESPPFEKIITYAPQGANPLQVHSYFGPPQVSYYYNHYGAPQDLLMGRPQFGCNYFAYC